MELNVKLNLEQWINHAKANSAKKKNKLNKELAQDILEWVSGGKVGYEGEIFNKWGKNLA